MGWKFLGLVILQKKCLCSKKKYSVFFKSGGQEVEFHEIEIMIMRSNLSNNIDQEVDTSIMRLKPKKALFLNSIS
jgi:hypothetical protein